MLSRSVISHALSHHLSDISLFQQTTVIMPELLPKLPKKYLGNSGLFALRYNKVKPIINKQLAL